MKEMSLYHPDFGSVRSVTVKGEPWFVAKDVCDILELTNSRKTLTALDGDEKGVTISDTLGGKQELATVNESGLYSLIMRSNKPAAKVFRKWVTSEVLPAIRRQGFYVHPSAQLTTKEFKKLHRIMLENVNNNITEEDIWACHKKLRESVDKIKSVLWGYMENSKIMGYMQDRAIINKENEMNAYSRGRVDEVIRVLNR